MCKNNNTQQCHSAFTGLTLPIVNSKLSNTVNIKMDRWFKYKKIVKDRRPRF